MPPWFGAWVTFIKTPAVQRDHLTGKYLWCGNPAGLHCLYKALPLALVCYVIAFGDFVTTETLVTEARQSRDDEYIDFNSSRSNLVSGIRNLILPSLPRSRRFPVRYGLE